MAKPGPLKIKNYGIDFKLRAVQLSNQPGGRAVSHWGEGLTDSDKGQDRADPAHLSRAGSLVHSRGQDSAVSYGLRA